MHSALKLHKSVMEGRRINVERTVGGGGDCSAVDRDVSPGVSYCASLNRAECSLVPNT